MTHSAVVFPGQGSQSVGMLAEMHAASERIAQTFAEASDAIGRDLWQLASAGPGDELNQTRWTQPVMLAADIALWREYRARGGELPLAMAGHSLGEYAALVAAGALEFTDAVRVVHARGELMQQAVAEGEGAMAAILGLDDEVVERICGDTEGSVVAANYNSPGQVVIAGSRISVERAVERCRQAGARRAMLLPVSVPAHSPLMEPAAAGLAAALAEVPIRAPQCPVLHNRDLKPHSEPEEIRQALVEQLTYPVPWTETVRELRGRGATRFLECGPARVLAGLGRRIDRDAEWIALESPDGMQQAVAA